MAKCKHVNVTHVGTRYKNGFTIREWQCDDCPKTFAIKRPGKTETWKWPD